MILHLLELIFLIRCFPVHNKAFNAKLDNEFTNSLRDFFEIKNRKNMKIEIKNLGKTRYIFSGAKSLPTGANCALHQLTKQN